MKISNLWASSSNAEWNRALSDYWRYLRPENVDLEHRMDALDLSSIEGLDDSGWYSFLLDEYFRWKYTAPNRYATTTASLRRYEAQGLLSQLGRIKKELLNIELANPRVGLSIAWNIKGLGPSGASGLLALMYPHAFGTCDQFVVKALCAVPGLPEANTIAQMNPESLTIDQCVLLVELMRRKATENTRVLAETWTPRMIDKVLWTLGHNAV